MRLEGAATTRPATLRTDGDAPTHTASPMSSPIATRMEVGNGIGRAQGRSRKLLVGRRVKRSRVKQTAGASSSPGTMRSAGFPDSVCFRRRNGGVNTGARGERSDETEG